MVLSVRRLRAGDGVASVIDRPLSATRRGRLQYKEALVQCLRRDGGEFHVVAQLPCGSSRAALEDALYAWVARMDRHYLGRSWSSSHRRADRMRGVAFFEASGGHEHAHLVVRPPAGASRLHFLLYARYFFQPHPERCLRRAYPRPIAARSSMKVWRIGPTQADLDRVLGYAAKGLEVGRDSWKFLDELSPREVVA